MPRYFCNAAAAVPSLCSPLHPRIPKTRKVRASFRTHYTPEGRSPAPSTIALRHRRSRRRTANSPGGNNHISMYAFANFSAHFLFSPRALSGLIPRPARQIYKYETFGKITQLDARATRRRGKCALARSFARSHEHIINTFCGCAHDTQQQRQREKWKICRAHTHTHTRTRTHASAHRQSARHDDDGPETTRVAAAPSGKWN